jgi:hypothetical protein
MKHQSRQITRKRQSWAPEEYSTWKEQRSRRCRARQLIMMVMMMMLDFCIGSFGSSLHATDTQATDAILFSTKFIFVIFLLNRHFTCLLAYKTRHLFRRMSYWKKYFSSDTIHCVFPWTASFYVHVRANYDENFFEWLSARPENGYAASL